MNILHTHISEALICEHHFWFQETDLLYYLRDELDCKDKELFLVVTNETEKDQSWLLDQASYSNSLNLNYNRDAEIVQLKDILSEGFIDPSSENTKCNHLS